MTIGEKLTQARLDNQLTQQQVAQYLFLTRQTISNWETGRSYPDVSSLIALSDLYQHSLDELLKGDKAMMSNLEKKERELKQNRQVYFASMIVDIILLVLLVMSLMGLKDFKLATGAQILLNIGILVNVITLLSESKRRRELVGRDDNSKKKLTIIRWELVVVFLLTNVLSVYFRGIGSFSAGVFVGSLLATVVILKFVEKALITSNIKK